MIFVVADAGNISESMIPFLGLFSRANKKARPDRLVIARPFVSRRFSE